MAEIVSRYLKFLSAYPLYFLGYFEERPPFAKYYLNIFILFFQIF